jgi:hypothetical protein
VSPGKLICIVEGNGECTAVPAVVNRILRHLRRDRVIAADPDRVICPKNGDCITEPYDPDRKLGIEYFVQRAANERPGGILVVVDAEDRCVERQARGLPGLGPDLLQRAQPFAGGVPVAVVVANRMFESWFLADFHSLRSRGYLPAAARLPSWRTPESLAGCKGRMRDLLGRKYSETRDQPLLALRLSLPLRPAMQRRAPSLFKLFREINKLSREARRHALTDP